MFPPDKARALWERFEFVYTPKHGSWLNMAEIELDVPTPVDASPAPSRVCAHD
jgi:epoxyqueuosine reductase QueG